MLLSLKRESGCVNGEEDLPPKIVTPAYQAIPAEVSAPQPWNVPKASLPMAAPRMSLEKSGLYPFLSKPLNSGILNEKSAPKSTFSRNLANSTYVFCSDLEAYPPLNGHTNDISCFPEGNTCLNSLFISTKTLSYPPLFNLSSPPASYIFLLSSN